jgi:hypothetical protein
VVAGHGYGRGFGEWLGLCWNVGAFGLCCDLFRWRRAFLRWGLSEALGWYWSVGALDGWLILLWPGPGMIRWVGRAVEVGMRIWGKMKGVGFGRGVGVACDLAFLVGLAACLGAIGVWGGIGRLVRLMGGWFCFGRGLG